MEPTAVQRRPLYRRRQDLQPAHPLDPLCGLSAPPPDQFFVVGHGWIPAYEINAQPLRPARGSALRLITPDAKRMSEIGMLMYSFINNLRARFRNSVK